MHPAVFLVFFHFDPASPTILPVLLLVECGFRLIWPPERRLSGDNMFAIQDILMNLHPICCGDVRY